MAPRKKPNENEEDRSVPIDWEKEMEQQAALAAEAQRSAGGGGKFFSMKSGVLSFDDNPLPGNQMAVIILADIMENSFYDGPYDPSTPASPKCFAFGHDEEDMEPHPKVDQDDYFERQNAQCEGCPQNEWGSAETGRGKACKNVVRLALIPAGQYKPQGKGRNAGLDLELFDDEQHFAKVEAAYLKIPVMSVKNYSKFVKQLSADLRRPPHGVITNIFLEPDPKSQFKVSFEVIDKVPSGILPIVMKRHAAEKASLDFPYSRPLEDEGSNRAPARSNNKLKGQRGSSSRGRK